MSVTSIKSFQIWQAILHIFFPSVIMTKCSRQRLHHHMTGNRATAIWKGFSVEEKSANKSPKLGAGYLLVQHKLAYLD